MLLFQVAYELACQGPVRPAGPQNDTMLYSLKCVAFEPPRVELEVVCVAPNENFFLGLAGELGQRLKSAACCSKIRYIRVGFVTLEHTLLEKHFGLENILNAIYDLKPLIDQNEHILSKEPTLKQPEQVDDELLEAGELEFEPDQ